MDSVERDPNAFYVVECTPTKSGKRRFLHGFNVGDTWQARPRVGIRGALRRRTYAEAKHLLRCHGGLVIKKVRIHFHFDTSLPR
jgi:hypothetical protein